MATSDLDSIAEAMKCEICLDTLCHPKQLVCHHEYCKGCIDNLLEFQGDGSANIKCPKKCTKITTIPPHDTTGDLGVSYTTKAVLEVVRTKEKEKSCDVKSKPHCQESNCRKDIEFYCINCKMFLCKSCTCCINKRTYKLRVSFDEDNDEISLNCKRHSTYLHWFCSTCVRAICCYCVHRKHRGHQCERIEHIMEVTRRYCDEQTQRLKLKWKVTEKSISVAKHLLNKNLEHRKMICLNEYTVFLNNEERRVKEVFDTMATKHKQQYKIDDCIPSYTSISKPMKFILRYQQVSQVNAFSALSKKVSLSNYCFNSPCPLGDVEVGYQVEDEEDISSFSSGLLDVEENIDRSQYTNLQQVLIQSFPKYKDVEALTKEIEKLNHDILQLKKDADENEELIKQLQIQKDNHLIKEVIAEEINQAGPSKGTLTQPMATSTPNAKRMTYDKNEELIEQLQIQKDNHLMKEVSEEEINQPGPSKGTLTASKQPMSTSTPNAKRMKFDKNSEQLPTNGVSYYNTILLEDSEEDSEDESVPLVQLAKKRKAASSVRSSKRLQAKAQMYWNNVVNSADDSVFVR